MEDHLKHPAAIKAPMNQWIMLYNMAFDLLVAGVQRQQL